jgi:hypothetical protein
MSGINQIGSFLVYPTAMLYPQNLIYVNLFDVLHRSKGELLQGKRYGAHLVYHSLTYQFNVKDYASSGLLLAQCKLYIVLKIYNSEY